MSLCRRVHCAVCEAIRRCRSLACVGAVGLPLLASGCSGMMHLAGADLLSVTEDGELASGGDSSRAGSARPRNVPSLNAAENSHASGDSGDASGNGGLAAFSAIEVSGESSTPPRTASTERPASTERKAARNQRRPERPAPTGPVSLFADEPARSASPARRDHVTLATAQEEVPATAVPRDDNGDDLTPTETMTVEKIVNVTARDHPLLRQRQAEIRLAEAELVGASILPNPQFVVDTDTPTQEAGPTSVGSRLTFTIPLGGRIGLAQQVADLGIRRAQLLASYEAEILVNAAVAAALEVLYWQERVVLQAEQVDLANELLRRARPPVVPESAVVSASVSAATLDFQRVDAVGKLRAARVRLSKAIGLNPPRAIRVEGELIDTPAPEIHLETLLAAVRENRPEIAEGQLSIIQGRRQLALAMAEGIPDLEIGPRFEDDFRSPTDSMGVRINTDLPLFDRNQGGVAESSATIGVNQATLGVTEMTTLSDVAEAFAQLDPLQSRLEALRERVPRLSRDAEISIRAAFRAGKIEIDNVINEQQRLVRLRLEHLNLKYQYNRLRALIELYAGRSLERLAEMEVQAPPAAAPHADNPFQDEPPAAAPGEPRARKDESAADSRIARSRSRSAVVPASAIEDGEPAAVSPLEYVKRFTQRKTPAASESLPYGNAAASAKKSR